MSASVFLMNEGELNLFEVTIWLWVSKEFLQAFVLNRYH